MLNPILYTEQVVGGFLRYQLTTYPFADDRSGLTESLAGRFDGRNAVLIREHSSRSKSCGIAARMKRRELIREIEAMGCLLVRHGGRHDWYQNPQTSPVNPFRVTARSKNIWPAIFFAN